MLAPVVVVAVIYGLYRLAISVGVAASFSI
jgi:hypothetical protein